jgi:hypothetical protein
MPFIGFYGSQMDVVEPIKSIGFIALDSKNCRTHVPDK